MILRNDKDPEIRILPLEPNMSDQALSVRGSSCNSDCFFVIEYDLN